MKKYIVLLIAVLTTAFTATAFAYAPPDKPANGWYVVDQAGKLSEDQKTQLNSQIDNINKTTKNEFGVLIVKSLDGDSIEDAAQDTFRAWGIGKADLNNGVLLLISVGDRKMRLQTGKGAEGDLPDLRAKDILDQQLKPALRKGEFYNGIVNTINTASSFMESHGSKQEAAKSALAAPVSPTPIDDVVKSKTDNVVSSVVGGIVLMLLLGALIVGGIIFTIVSVISTRKRRALEILQAEQQLEASRAYRKRVEAERLAAAERARLQREYEASLPAKVVPVKTAPVMPVVPAPHPASSIRTPAKASPVKTSTVVAAASVSAAAVAAAATLAAKNEAARKEAAALAAKEEAERSARRRREQEEEDRRAAKRKRDQEDDDRRRESSYSSSSSSFGGSDFGSSSGGGFGGGDSGGGGGSSDW